MKYANSLKYVNSFDEADSLSALSLKRIRDMCSELGRINVGAKCIVTPKCCAGYAGAVMLESVIKSAGYRVGRITSEYGFDSRTSVYLDGDIADIEDYNKCVAEIKSIVIKNPDEKYFRQEIVFVLSLLLCRLHGCEFIILEGLSDEGYSLDSLCAPFDLVVVPTVYSSENDTTVKMACDAIKRGDREVLSGNQKNAVYTAISNACMHSGIRLNVTAKPTFSVASKSARRIEFSYADRDGYVLKSPSIILRDCAMLVIESALALRRDGIKMPWGSIASGLESCNNASCFDILSAAPTVVVDSACAVEEIASMLETFEETVEPLGEMTVCINSDSYSRLESQLKAFEGKNLQRLIVCGISDPDDAALHTNFEITLCDSVLSAAKNVYQAFKEKRTVFSFGSVAFAQEIKTEFIKLMGL